MEFTSIEREPGAFQQGLALDGILSICRNISPESVVRAVHELSGGEFNTIYRIELDDEPSLILRVGPPSSSYVPWHEAELMRREYAIRPYFAPVAPLMPRIILADFTRRLINRNYIIQDDMPGEQWQSIEDSLSPYQEESLWRQLARIAKTIHSIEGDSFGLPFPGLQFSSWSQTVISWLEHVIAEAVHVGLDVADLQVVVETVRHRASVLDEIRRPCLLHGDLWTGNVLVRREETDARIVAVLDTDRASWGDPLADWTFSLLDRIATPTARAVFWHEYGEPVRDDRGVQFRHQVYGALHAGNGMSWARRHDDEESVSHIYGLLHDIAAEVTTYLS